MTWATSTHSDSPCCSLPQTVKLGLLMLPHLAPHGGVHAQTAPSVAYSTALTSAHARRLVALYMHMSGGTVTRERVCIKIPATVEGLRAAALLEKDGVRTLATTVFCIEQALAAAEGANCTVSPLRISAFRFQLSALADSVRSRSSSTLRRMSTRSKHISTIPKAFQPRRDVLQSPRRPLRLCGQCRWSCAEEMEGPDSSRQGEPSENGIVSLPFHPRSVSCDLGLARRAASSTPPK